MALDPRNILPITALNPAQTPPPDKRIRGIVTLLWPYSSSTRSCALLLGDPDFRLRSRRGQVRVRFAGPCAVAVAEGRVGIGDHVELSLEGAKWVPEDEATARRTPGKSVEGELLFGARIELRFGVEVDQEGKFIRVEEDEEREGFRKTGALNGVQTPIRRGRGTGDWIGGFHGVVPIYSSPAFVRRARLSAEGFTEPSPFDEWDKAEHRPRKKPRFSLEGFKSWRYTERSPSPEAIHEEHQMPAQDDVTEHVIAAPSQESKLTTLANGNSNSNNYNGGPEPARGEATPSQTTTGPGSKHTNLTSIGSLNDQDSEGLQLMQPPPIPSIPLSTQISVPSISPQNLHQRSQAQRPRTPKIQPIASETLPLPSPFPNDASHLQLGAVQASLGLHLESSEEIQSALAAIYSDPATHSARPANDARRAGTDQHTEVLISNESVSNAQEFSITRGQDESGHVPLQQEGQDDDGHRTRENSADASLLQLTYIQDLSDTEEDDGEMYTNRFTQKLFDSQLVDAHVYQEIEDATEDDADGDSGPATPIQEGVPRQTMDSANKQVATPHSERLHSKRRDRELSVEPTASVAKDIRHEIARSEWTRGRSNDGPQTPTEAISRLDGADSTGTTPRKPTPQSEKDKIMAQTYRSLFGFGGHLVKPAYDAPALTAQSQEGPAAAVETERSLDELPRIADDAVAFGNQVDGGHQELQPIQDTQNASGIMLDLAAEDNENSVVTPTHAPIRGVLHTSQTSDHSKAFPRELPDLDIHRSGIDRQDVVMQNIEDARLRPQPSELEILPQGLEQLPEEPLTAQMNEDLPQSPSCLPNADMSFPSTTAVGTDYLSPTEPVSFERMLHPDTVVDENDLLSFADTQAADLVIPPGVDIRTEVHSEQAISRDKPLLAGQNFAAETTLLEVGMVQPSTPKNTLSQDVIPSKRGKSIQGIDEDDGDDDGSVIHLSTEDRDTGHSIPVDQSLPAERDSNMETIQVTSNIVEDSARSEDTALKMGRAKNSAPDGESAPQRDEQLIDSAQATRPPPNFKVTQPTAHVKAPPSPIHSQEQVHSQASITENGLAALKGERLPPTPQLTQGDSLIKGADLEVESASPKTPQDKPSPEFEASHDISQAERIDHSPTTTPLRRSTRASQKQRPNSSHKTLPQVVESSDTSPPNRPPGGRSSRKSQTPADSESIAVSTPSVKATPTRRSGRLKAQTGTQNGGPGVVAMDSIQKPRKTGRSRALSKTLPTETSEEIGENITTASVSDDVSIQPDNPLLESDTQPGVTKLSTRSHTSRQTPKPAALEPALRESAPNTSARKPTTYKFSTVPDVISHWFSPRRSSRLHTDAEKPTATSEPAAESAADITEVRASGIATSFSYYTPLSNISEKLNTPSQSAAVDSAIDVLAVVATDSKAPERAKSGPRHYYTVFDITDPSLHSSPVGRVHVEVFRPWHAKLPVAQAGDVVLLRAHVVKSRKRRPYLLSTDASAWCVWRYGTNEGGDDGEEAGVGEVSKAPASATKRRRGEDATATPREEVKGPPVELGAEERSRARELRDWWVSGSRS